MNVHNLRVREDFKGDMKHIIETRGFRGREQSVYKFYIDTMVGVVRIL